MISVFSVLNKVILEEDIVVDGDFSIIHNSNRLEEIGSENTFIAVGSIYYQSIIKQPVIIQRLQEENVNPYNLVKSFRGYFQHFLLSLWLLKDNSINLDDIVLIDTNQNVIFTDRNPLLFSNSQGEYVDVNLATNEVHEALIWFERLKPYFMYDAQTNDYKGDEYDGSIEVHMNNNNKDIEYYRYNRLERAIRFIALARGESFPPAKITFYISALESLFSTSNIEVKMQVADRTARVLSKDFEERIKINKVVGIAYSFRSNYIHGSVNSQKTIRKILKPYDTIEEISCELDEILRRVSKLFLTDLNHVIKMDDSSFSVWISELLYKEKSE
ncbi:hypothetical protein LXM61_27375 [Priestia megaterium]|uniref:HEPN domain-containing protein n=1 Tax=Priestia megaterium TaxID=1404 RepID=UPI001E343103|nr:HEPN domain-containing protein [Priestia megaterium]MCE4092869.1 hypothetical protein [Priestia megaterium]